MDLTQTGWFNDPGMWQHMTALKALDDELLRTPTPFQPEVAAIVDESSMQSVAAKAQEVTRACVYEVRQKLGRLGAPYGQYLLDDVLNGRVKAKLFVMLNAWSLTSAQRDKLREVTRGSVCVWCYAPGWFDGKQTSLDAMEQLTGFKLAPQDKLPAWAMPKENTLTQPFGVHQPIKPLFAITDANGSETLARFANQSVAAALRDHTMLVTAPGLTTELLRLAAKKVDVHLFTEADCNVYASGAFLALHASQDGEVKLNTGHSAPILDMLTQKKLGDGSQLTLPMKMGETRVLRIK
jgi:hypothetical protein